jgi:TatD DNase family protein
VRALVELVDSHCHLDDEQFDSDRDAVIERARAAGLKYMLAIGTGHGPPDLETALRLANQHSYIYATVGVHPNDSEKATENTFTKLETLLRHSRVKALGEIGLDYHWGVPKEVQQVVFIRQLEIAAAARIPIVIHTRDAWSDTLDVLRGHWTDTSIPCIMHCFTGNVQHAQECIDLGFYLSFGGVTTFPKATDIREAVGITPIERLLLETDSPYLAPVPHRGKRNEPAFVAHTAKTIAETRAVPFEDLANQSASFSCMKG